MKCFFDDVGVILGRSMKHITRSVDTIITTAIMPIAIMLLFVFVLGGAIQTGSDNYVTYQLPGIFLITLASGISYTAYRLFADKQRGVFERFHSMPIARSAPLWSLQKEGETALLLRLHLFFTAVREDSDGYPQKPKSHSQPFCHQFGQCHNRLKVGAKGTGFAPPKGVFQSAL